MANLPITSVTPNPCQPYRQGKLNRSQAILARLQIQKNGRNNRTDTNGKFRPITNSAASGPPRSQSNMPVLTSKASHWPARLFSA